MWNGEPGQFPLITRPPCDYTASPYTSSYAPSQPHLCLPPVFFRSACEIAQIREEDRIWSGGQWRCVSVNDASVVSSANASRVPSRRRRSWERECIYISSLFTSTLADTIRRSEITYCDRGGRHRRIVCVSQVCAKEKRRVFSPALGRRIAESTNYWFAERRARAVLALLLPVSQCRMIFPLMLHFPLHY